VYDFATVFKDGIAVVYNDSVPQCIDTKGNIRDAPQNTLDMIIQERSKHFPNFDFDPNKIFSKAIGDSTIKSAGAEKNVKPTTANKQLGTTYSGGDSPVQQLFRICDVDYQRSAQSHPLDSSGKPVAFGQVPHIFPLVSLAFVPMAKKDAIEVIALPNDTVRTKLVTVSVGNDTIIEPFEGMKVIFYNSTNDTIRADAVGTGIVFVLQAQHENGKWHDIEKDPRYDDFDIEALPPRSAVVHAITLYRGTLKMKLRLKVYCTRTSKETGRENRFELYSNEFIGSINPAQLWHTWDSQDSYFEED
jgi:hypothetical protein